jgi:hypothetical protein
MDHDVSLGTGRHGIQAGVLLETSNRQVRIVVEGKRGMGEYWVQRVAITGCNFRKENAEMMNISSLLQVNL